MIQTLAVTTFRNCFGYFLHLNTLKDIILAIHRVVSGVSRLDVVRKEEKHFEKSFSCG